MPPRRRKIHSGTKPETKIQKAIVNLLKINDWHIVETHGNMYQSGLPDLYACHLHYGSRWIEVKVKDRYKFTSAQLENFPAFAAKGVRIWILTEATQAEYDKLFKPANWHMFLDIMKHNSRLRIS